MDKPRSIGVMQISVHGSGNAPKKDSALTLNRFLRHPVKEAFNDFTFTFQTPLLTTPFNGCCHLRGDADSQLFGGAGHKLILIEVF